MKKGPGHCPGLITLLLISLVSRGGLEPSTH
jgi:hypothetical protein